MNQRTRKEEKKKSRREKTKQKSRSQETARRTIGEHGKKKWGEKASLLPGSAGRQGGPPDL